ncbi:hypothetical protein ANO11243_093040 [Dothideomycetidae sp. 11243]|nr:hypothetical protein ANO11243_093040 [fungal sp. No.11243]
MVEGLKPVICAVRGLSGAWAACLAQRVADGGEARLAPSTSLVRTDSAQAGLAEMAEVRIPGSE